MKTIVGEFILFTGDGGVENLIKEYAENIDKEKYSIIVITMQRMYNSSTDKALSFSGIKIIPLYEKIYNNQSIPYRLIRKINNIWYIPYKLRKIINQENISVLHIHLKVLFLISLIRKSLKSVKLIYTCHVEPKLAFQGKRVLEKYAARLLIKKNNMVIAALHDDMKKSINQILKTDNSTIVLHNAISFDRFKNVYSNKEQIRALLGIPNDAFVIGNVGAFVETKNHAFLIEVFIEVLKNNKNAFLLLVGSGNKESVLEIIKKHNIKDKCLILEHRTDIPQIMKSMDVFVFPSKTEGLGIVVIEAQVCGLKCVISNKVPKEVKRTELVYQIDLKRTPKQWCDVILYGKKRSIQNNTLMDYDMKNEIKRLELLYSNDNHNDESMF